ncbi:MAG: histone deacetylase family protein [Candidatus Bipolaricaulia bacterium]
MKLIFSPRCLEFHQVGHPESPERIRAAYDDLAGKYLSLEPEPATEEDLLQVHSAELIDRVQRLDFYDPDNPRYSNIYEYARLAVGGAILAAEVGGLSLMRPPGHHAGRNRVAGFCYFNNIAVAVRRLGVRTLILDIDGHHGDGTQEIFLGDAQVVYISLHRSPLYPGTGLRSEGNCYNYPLEAGCGDRRYLETLETALGVVDVDGIEQIAISAGFDAYWKDPLASLGLTTDGYRAIGRWAAELHRPWFAVLEGGYDVGSLGRNIDALIEGLSGTT